NATRKDEPDAKATVDLRYAPHVNSLSLKADLSEPQGGLLARLLHLPGAPSVDLTLDGAGPLSDWLGRLDGSVAGSRILSVEGRHVAIENDRARILISGGGELSNFLPPAFRPLFNGTTRIDVATVYSPAGRIDIERGELT